MDTPIPLSDEPTPLDSPAAEETLNAPARGRQSAMPPRLAALLLVVAVVAGWAMLRITVVEKPVPGAIPAKRLQAELAEPGRPVVLDYVGVTGVAEDGFWVQDLKIPEQMQHGIWVAAGEGWPAKFPGIHVGASVTLRGVYEEYDASGQWPISRTQLRLSPGGAAIRGPAELPLPAGVSFPIVARADFAEPYEGVLIDAQPNLNPNLTVAEVGSNGDGIVLTDGFNHLALGTFMYRPLDLKVGDKLAHVYGILHYRDGRYALHPRSAADLVR